MQRPFSTYILCVLIFGGLVVCLSQDTKAQTAVAQTQAWQVQTLRTRTDADGQAITIAFAVRAPQAQIPKHIVLFVSSFTTPQLKVRAGTTALSVNGPWIRAAARLNARGVALAFADAPSDGQSMGLTNRSATEIAADIQVVIRSLKLNFPGVLVHLAGFGGGVNQLLEAASKAEGLSRVLIASGNFTESRTSDWRHFRLPVLLIHAPSAQCAASPFIEAQEIATQNNFALIRAGYEHMEAQPNCGPSSQHALAGLHNEVADMVADWLTGSAPPQTIGYAQAQIAWRERVVSYSAQGLQLEMSLFLPAGTGPFPVLVFNHGDAEIDSPYRRYKARFRDMLVATKFLRLGWAVAMPERRGIGLSQGNYPRDFSTQDADPGYKARAHAPDVLAALTYLRTCLELDTKHIVLSGQSAGGYTTMYLASLGLPGVVGAINFSGGRTDKAQTGVAGYLNQMMIKGFTEFGKTSRIPTLWIYAENDSRYSPATIRAAHQAFIQAGGQAILLLSPPIEGDGHSVHHKSQVWQAAVGAYLAGLL